MFSIPFATIQRLTHRYYTTKQSGDGALELFIPVLFLILGKAMRSRKRNNSNLKTNKRLF